jgi:hypothetical protein
LQRGVKLGFLELEQLRLQCKRVEQS